MGVFDSAGGQLARAWNSLSLGHRIILLLLCVVCVGGLAAAVWWAGRPQYRMLSGGLGPEESSELVRSLEEAGIAAQMGAGGSAVLVPAGKLQKARMLAAETGVGGGLQSGFESFRNPKMGLTPFAEKVNYVSALQNELSATIRSLEEVRDARVHLVLPEESLFKKDRKKSSASVLVTTRAGGRLAPKRAAAIANLVASAVSELSPQDVTISDGEGNVLAGDRQTGPEMAAGDQWGYRRTVERDLESKAESMLARVLGPERCEVRVSADLDFKDSKETRREYSPSSRVVVNEKIESTESSGGGMRVGGPAGASGNTEGQAQTGSPSPQSSETENIETKYMVGESVRETLSRGATIKRLSVAVVLDASKEAPSADSDQPGQSAAGTQAGPSTQAITDIVKDAVGFDQARGDSLKILEAEFPPPPTAAAPAGLPPWVGPAARYGAVGVLGLVLLVVARKVMKGLEFGGQKEVIIPEVVDAEGGSYPANLSQDELLRQEVAKIVQNDPKSASRLLEGWVEQEE